MSFQFHPYFYFLAISSLITLAIFVIANRHSAPGSVSLSGMLLGMFIWGFAYAITWSSIPLDQKKIWLKIMYLGVVMIPISFFFFTLQLTHREHWVTFRNITILSIHPVTMTLMIWLAPQKVFLAITEKTLGGYNLLEVIRGGWFWVNTVYSYLIILFSFGLLLHEYRRVNHLFKRQYLIILLGSVIPFILSVYAQTKSTAFKELDFAPISFGVSGVVYAYAIFRHQLMNLVPIARDRLIENMSDGVLVLDVQGRIVDINPAMENFLEAPPTSFIGRNVSEALNIWNESTEPLLSGLETRTELNLPGKTDRYLDLRVTPIYDNDQRLNGRLIIFRDVTDRKEVEKDLRHAMDRLQTQLIEIGLLQSQLREQAIRDALTDLFNRRYLDDTLDREIARATRETYPLCIIMMDIDHFKNVNDSHTHEAGDLVLKKLAQTLKEQSRQGDFACRYGGEEFVLVMPNIDLKVAKARAKSLHQKISSMIIPYEGTDIKITVSMGISMFPKHGESRGELLRAADSALYESKNAGRNRITVFSAKKRK